MRAAIMSLYLPPVALLAEGVDRNVVDDSHLEALEGVALLAEGVDRNCQLAEGILCREVALLAEGVDRNSCLQVESSKPAPSPSSRRAWIEIKSKRIGERKMKSRPPRGGRG